MMLILSLVLLFTSQISSHPIIKTKSLSTRVSEKNWLWNWAWASESTVSIVDRHPPLSFASRPAAFGADLTDPLLGYIIPLSAFTVPCDEDNGVVGDNRTNTGCPKLCVSGPTEPEPSENWIALVQRGQCSFVDKVREAQRLGANAVVVGGDDPNVSGNPDTLVNMYSPVDSSDVHIGATFIRYTDYVTLSSLIAASNTSHAGLRTLSLLITSDYANWEWYSPILSFTLILLLPSLLTFITLLVHRVRAARAARRDRAPEDIVRHLPWRVFTGNGWEKHQGGEDPHAPSSSSCSSSPDAPTPSAEESQDSVPKEPTSSPSPSQQLNAPPEEGEQTQPWFERQLECAICLSEFVKGDKVRELPCNHIFHLDEVDEWLIHRKKLCPVCKADVTQPLQPYAHEAASANSTPDSNTVSPAADEDPSANRSNERTPLLS